MNEALLTMTRMIWRSIVGLEKIRVNVLEQRIGCWKFEMSQCFSAS
jgi:hypothetical protein